MNRLICGFAVVPLAILLAGVLPGCGQNSPRYTKEMEEFNQGFHDLADTLETVHDAESARRVVEEIESEFARVVELLHRYGETDALLDEGFFNPATLERLSDDMERAFERYLKQLERVRNIRGLPIEFWRVIRHGSCNVAVASLEHSSSKLPQEVKDWKRILQDLLVKHGHDRVVVVFFGMLPSEFRQHVLDKIRSAAPNATLHHQADPAEETLEVVIGPVDDFQAIVAAIDFGTITSQDEPRRVIVVRVDPHVPAAGADSHAEQQRFLEGESRRESRRHQEEAEARFDRFRQEHGLPARPPATPQPGDSDYYEQLLQQITADDLFRKEDAVKVLLKTEPSQVTNAETRKQIARAFKDLAFDGRHSQRAAGVKGLVVWGGKYSVPLLLDLLAEDPPFIKKEIFNALGQLKDKRAAAPLAARLGNFFDRDEARRCLRRMGSVAEDALLEVAPSNDANVCLAAIQLLGEVGTKKSLSTLRSAQRSRNQNVRSAAKLAQTKVLERNSQAQDPRQPGR